jgi:hypothetical protein
MCDNAKSALPEKEHLRIPIVGGQRPAVAEHDRLSRSPIFVVDLCAVFNSDGRHYILPFSNVIGGTICSEMRHVRSRERYIQQVVGYDTETPRPLQFESRKINIATFVRAAASFL